MLCSTYPMIYWGDIKDKLQYWVLRAQADWTFILPSELPTKELHHLPRKMPWKDYKTSQYVVPHSGIFLGKWRNTFTGSSGGKMYVQSACALNTHIYIYALGLLTVP
jgi:hypothetical protein